MDETRQLRHLSIANETIYARHLAMIKSNFFEFFFLIGFGNALLCHSMFNSVCFLTNFYLIGCRKRRVTWTWEPCCMSTGNWWRPSWVIWKRCGWNRMTSSRAPTCKNCARSCQKRPTIRAGDLAERIVLHPPQPSKILSQFYLIQIVFFFVGFVSDVGGFVPNTCDSL